MSIKNDTALQALEDWMNGVFQQVDRSEVRLTTFVEKPTLTFLATAKPYDTWSKSEKAKTLGCITHKGLWDTGFESVSIETFMRWLEQIPEFKAKWNSVQDFLTQVTGLASEIQKKVRSKALKHATEESELSDALTGKRASYTYKWLIFNTSLSSLKTAPSPMDVSFLYDHLAILPMDGPVARGQYYWRFEDTGLEMIPMDRDGRSIAPDTAFWTHWWAENAGQVYAFSQSVCEILSRMYTALSSPMEGDDMLLPESIEEEVRKVCPSVLLRILAVGQVFKEVDKTKTLIPTSEFVPALRRERQYRTSMDKTEWEPYLCKQLLRDIDFSRVRTIRVFSNVPFEAQHYLGPKPIPRPCTEEPTLDECPTWSMFLENKFPSEKMGRFRLASFVLSMLDASNYNRQLLACFGGGSDGKSTLGKSLANLVGESLSKKDLPASAFKSNFGLSKVINKRFLLVDDTKLNEVSDFVNCDTVKRFTGAGYSGSLQIDVKNATPVEWQISGAKLAVITNGSMTLCDEASVSRVNPLLVLRNFKRSEEMDSATLEERLKAERAPFIQWCADYFNFYVNIRNVKGEKNRLYSSNGVAVLTDAMWQEWLDGVEENIWADGLSEARYLQMRKEAFEAETTIPGEVRARCYVAQEGAEDALEEDEDYFSQIVSALFVRGEESVSLTGKQIQRALAFVKQNQTLCGLGAEVMAAMAFTGLLAVPLEKLRYSMVYRKLIEAFKNAFDVQAVSVRRGKGVQKEYPGIALRHPEWFSADVPRPPEGDIQF